MTASGFSADFFAGSLIGVAFGILLGLAFTLTYVMKQFRRLDQDRRNIQQPMWASTSKTTTYKGLDPNSVSPVGSTSIFNPEHEATI